MRKVHLAFQDLSVQGYSPDPSQSSLKGLGSRLPSSVNKYISLVEAFVTEIKNCDR